MPEKLPTTSNHSASPERDGADLRREIEDLRIQLAHTQAEVEAGLASVTELYEELATLYRLGETFARTTDRGAMIQKILSLAAESIECGWAATLLPGSAHNDGGNRFTWGAGHNAPVSPGEPAQLTADETLLLRALAQSSAIIVNDFAEDHRLDSGLCRGLGLERALAARFGEGDTYGLLILGRMPGSEIFTAGHAKLLGSLVGALSNFLENDRLRRQELDQQRTEQQLAIARDMQQMLLPRFAPAHPLFNAAGSSRMARHVGGDYYYFHAFADGRYGLMVADVSGKGVPAALLMTMLKGVLTGLPLERLTPGQTLNRLNNVIYREGLSDRFVTMAYVICDAKRDKLIYASAGHEPILQLKAAGGEVRSLPALDLPLGLIADLEPVDQEEDFQAGDALVLYSDGVVEARNMAAEFYETSRLNSALMQCQDHSAQHLIRVVAESVAEFVGAAEQFDDLTIAALQYAPGENA